MEKIDKYISLSEDIINTLKKEINDQYNKYLKPFNVKELGENTNAMYQLIYLYYYQGKAVSKDVITAFVQEHRPKASGDQQVRHLSAQKGYNVLGRNGVYKNEKMPLGYYLLVNLTEPDVGWKNNEIKRITTLTASSFDIIKQNFNYCCATCGQKEGAIHSRTNKIITLQKGHIDPSKPLDDGNVIPQCEYCNQNVYKNDFIFTSFGYPDSIYNPKYVLKSKEDVQLEMYKILKEKFGGI